MCDTDLERLWYYFQRHSVHVSNSSVFLASTDAVKPDVCSFEQLTVMAFIKSRVIDELKSELSLYTAHAKDIDNDFCPLNWC